jgi:adenylate cyclase
MLLRGLERLRRFTPEDNRLSRDFFERALALDPNFARAHADLAFSYSTELLFGWTAVPEETIGLAKKHGEFAIELDPNQREVQFAMASVLLRERRFNEAIESSLRAIKIDPNYADGYAQMAWILAYAGRAGEGIDLIEKAMRLNPHYSFFYSSVLGQTYFHLKRFAEAAVAFEAAVDRNPQFSIGRRFLAATYAHLGRIEDAGWEADELLTLLPDFTISAERARAPYKREQDLDLYIEGLRKAGLPE